jgi:hypothetical protein
VRGHRHPALVEPELGLALIIDLGAVDGAHDVKPGKVPIEVR